MNFVEFKNSFEKIPIVQFAHCVEDHPEVSVCVQTYNHAKFIRRCLDGILMQQTNFRFEILVGEDASADHTREICVEYAQKFPEKIRLFLHHRDNNIRIGGTPTGRFNFVYNLFSAQGKYIAVCEGDDYWTDQSKLQNQYDLLELDPKYSGCFHLTEQLSPNGERLRIYGQKAPEVVFSEDTFSHLSLFHTSSFFFRSKAIHDHLPDWFCQIISADMALFSIVAKGGSIKKVSRIMSVYLKHDGGMTSMYTGNRIRFNQDRILLFEKLNEFYNYKYEVAAKRLITFYRHNAPKSKFRHVVRLLSKVRSFFKKRGEV